ncbi:hypothetical protein L1887_03615 [Cichorium endivia]|nr:hypothetical protein L1887_03615 [Cichorium endivia]
MSTDEDMVKQGLMRTGDISKYAAAVDTSSSSSSPSASAGGSLKDSSKRALKNETCRSKEQKIEFFASAVGSLKDSSMMQKKFQKLSRNVSEAIASLKNSLNLDPAGDLNPTRIDTSRKHVWGSVVRNLTWLYPGSQLSEKFVSNIRKHYDSLPLSFAPSIIDKTYHIKPILYGIMALNSEYTYFLESVCCYFYNKRVIDKYIIISKTQLNLKRKKRKNNKLTIPTTYQLTQP